MVVVGLVLVWRRAGSRWLAFLLVSCAGTEILFWALKFAFDRPRPPVSLGFAMVSSPSYPSGHTAIATAVAVSLLVTAARARRPVLRHAARAGLVALPLVVGLSRLALGVHWLTDVIGGFLLGLGWVLACAALLPRPRESADELRAGGRSEGYVEVTGRHRAPARRRAEWDSRSFTSRSSGRTGRR
jgi:undecaprenyl-diphosphatase